jgi:endonuclease/exonuclease/phosphatase family metal-dependent hydrolase
MRIKIVSYNIHRCIGADHRHDPERIKDVLVRLRPDLAALQEVERLRDSSFDLIAYLEGATGMTAIKGTTMILEHSRYGNVLLSRYPIQSVRLIDLSFPGREKRGAIDAEIAIGGHAVRIMATHLGLKPLERRAQIKKLLAVLADDLQVPTTLLCGDLNEWFLWGRPLRWLHRYFGQLGHIRTFPARLPMFALDRIWCHPVDKLQWLRAEKTTLAREASDHLPLVAVVELL